MADDETTPANGGLAAAYWRRRVDDAVDHRFATLERAVERLETRQAVVESKLQWFAGILAVVTVLANIFGPQIAAALGTS